MIIFIYAVIELKKDTVDLYPENGYLGLGPERWNLHNWDASLIFPTDIDVLWEKRRIVLA